MVSDNTLQPRLEVSLAYSMNTMPLGGSASAREELRTVIEHGPELVRYAVVHHSHASHVLDQWRQGDYQPEPGRLLTFPGSA